MRSTRIRGFPASQMNQFQDERMVPVVMVAHRRAAL
jgi:hypothetical protein